MIQTIDQTLRYMRGEITMTNEEKFKGFNFNNLPKSYDEEARKSGAILALRKQTSISTHGQIKKKM